MWIRILLIGSFLLLLCLSILGSLANAGSAMARVVMVVAPLTAIVTGVVFYRHLYHPLRLLKNYVDDIRRDPTTAHMRGEFIDEVGALQASIMELNIQAVQMVSDAEVCRMDAEQHAVEAERALAAVSAREQSMQEMFSHMRVISHKAREVSNSLASEMRTLSQMVAAVGHGVEIQRFRLEDTAEAMDAITDSVLDVSRNVGTASDGAHASREKAEVGAGEVREAVTAIETVKKTTQALKGAMSELGKRASNIGHVMGVISEVADQTNLLALNAAIEAARAGEAGRGFAVVADEVRKLAERTMHATGEVEEAVKSIQEETQRNVLAVDAAAEHTVHSAASASRAGTFMTEIVREMDGTAEQLHSIAKATDEQSRSSSLTNKALEEVSEVAQTTAVQMQKFTSTLVLIESDMEELDIIVHALSTGELTYAIGNTRLVEWTPKLETGLELIDSQHRMLCAYINSLHRAMQQGQADKALGEIVTSLKNYTATHFSTEEQYFGHTAYPDVEAHKQVHRNFVAKVTDVEAQLARGSAKVSLDLLNFLKDWLIKHIQGTDKQYVPHVMASMRAGKKHKRA